MMGWVRKIYRGDGRKGQEEYKMVDETGRGDIGREKKKS